MTDSTRVRTTDLEAALLAWVPQQRWFAAKGSRVVSLAVVARVPLGSRPGVSAEHLLGFTVIVVLFFTLYFYRNHE